MCFFSKQVQFTNLHSEDSVPGSIRVPEEHWVGPADTSDSQMCDYGGKSLTCWVERSGAVAQLHLVVGRDCGGEVGPQRSARTQCLWCSLIGTRTNKAGVADCSVGVNSLHHQRIVKGAIQCKASYMLWGSRLACCVQAKAHGFVLEAGTTSRSKCLAEDESSSLLGIRQWPGTINHPERLKNRPKLISPRGLSAAVATSTDNGCQGTSEGRYHVLPVFIWYLGHKWHVFASYMKSFIFFNFKMFFGVGHSIEYVPQMLYTPVASPCLVPNPLMHTHTCVFGF